MSNRRLDLEESREPLAFFVREPVNNIEQIDDRALFEYLIERSSIDHQQRAPFKVSHNDRAERFSAKKRITKRRASKLIGIARIEY
jgi:hypothetical protein